MFDIVMEVFWCICSLIGISIILMNFFCVTRIGNKFFEFLKQHRKIGIAYVILGAIGIFRAVIFNIFR